MTSLLQRLVGRPKRVPIAVTVYTRRECCCCHKAMDVLETFRRKYNLVIDAVDIDADPALVAAHGQSVPVVAIDGKVRFRGLVDASLLKRLLDATDR